MTSIVVSKSIPKLLWLQLEAVAKNSLFAWRIHFFLHVAFLRAPPPISRACFCGVGSFLAFFTPDSATAVTLDVPHFSTSIATTTVWLSHLLSAVFLHHSCKQLDNFSDCALHGGSNCRLLLL